MHEWIQIQISLSIIIKTPNWTVYRLNSNMVFPAFVSLWTTTLAVSILVVGPRKVFAESSVLFQQSRASHSFTVTHIHLTDFYCHQLRTSRYNRTFALYSASWAASQHCVRESCSGAKFWPQVNTIITCRLSTFKCIHSLNRPTLDPSNVFPSSDK